MTQKDQIYHWQGYFLSVASALNLFSATAFTLAYKELYWKCYEPNATLEEAK